MGTLMSVMTYLFVFSIDPIMIELIAPEGAAFVICPVITLAIRAVHPVGAVLALRGRRNRWLAIGVTSAAACKLAMGILVMGFAILGAYRCLLGAVLIGMSPLPAFPAKWSPDRLAGQTDGNCATCKMEATPTKGAHLSTILRVLDFKEGLHHLRSPRCANKLRPAAQDHVITKGTLPKHSLHSVCSDFNAIGTVRYVEELAIAL
jgi:hypothetical protein